MAVFVVLQQSVMGKSEIKSLTQISNLSSNGLSFEKNVISPFLFKSQIFHGQTQIKCQIFNKNKYVNKFSIDSEDNHI